MQDSKEKQCLIFVRNNANDTADRIEAYAKKSGMEVVETVFNTDKKAVERLRYLQGIVDRGSPGNPFCRVSVAVRGGLYRSKSCRLPRCGSFRRNICSIFRLTV